jgi:hypothetical protein
MAVNIPIWNGSSTFAAGQTPLGFYDNQADFVAEIDKVTNWCAQKLGYPVNDVELPSGSLYACFEEAINEYANHVNSYNIRDNFINLYATTASVQLTQKAVSPTLQGMIELAKDYGTEAGAIGNVNVYTASIAVKAGQQVYDLTNASTVTFEQGDPSTDSYEIRRVFHEATPAIVRYFDPFVGTGLGSEQMLDAFGWGGYSPGVSFMMMPMYADTLRLQAIEFNDQIRKSAYGFDIKNKTIRLFPIPSEDMTVYFNYMLDSEKGNALKYNAQSGSLVSDYSTMPYGRMDYNLINEVGRNWIRRYTLELARELLGQVRSKYSSLPIPNSEITLNGGELISNALTKQESLVTELKELLDSLSRQMQLERKQAESDALQQQMTKIPMGIYIG